jgi:DNA-binding MarR family transcriptional regulator
MERDGLVVRRPHPGDGRAQSIHLTARARGLEEPATAAANGVNRRLLASLDREERARFIAAMGCIVESARAT